MPGTPPIPVALADLACETRHVAPAATYPRRPPAFANLDLVAPEDRRALEARWHAPDQGAPPIDLHRLGAASIAFPGLVHLPDGSAILESLHNLPRARTAALLARGPRAAATIPGDAPALLLARAGSGNYGHWLVEHLGALLLLRDAAPDLAPRLLVQDRRGHAIWPVLEAGVALAGFDPAALLPVGPAGVGVRDLWMFSPASAHPYMKHPAAIEALAGLAPRRPATDRLFIRRTSTTKRVLHNLDAVEAAATRMGFRTIEPGRMSFAEQIEAFAGARIVAGVSGADLTNIAFMPRGGDVVCLLPAAGRNFFFWDVCCLRGHRYWSVFGPGLTGRGGGHDDFTVDADLAATILERAVSAP